MIGKIEVYLYTEENGERENLTSILGNENFNIYEHKIESLRLVKMLYYNSHFENKYISFYSLSQIKLDLFPNFFMLGYIFRLKSSEVRMSVNGISCNLAEHNKRQKYGNSYEIFIANKYKETGYEVENRGVKESFNDGGLDIIAIKDNNTSHVLRFIGTIKDITNEKVNNVENTTDKKINTTDIINDIK